MTLYPTLYTNKILKKNFELEDFSFESNCKYGLVKVIDEMNAFMKDYISGSQQEDSWNGMIGLLPSSYNQRRVVMLNYRVLSDIYKTKRPHRMSEWRKFCDWIKELPYSDLITGENE